MGKSSINGPFSMAMLNNQRVFKKKKHLSVKPAIRAVISLGFLGVGVSPPRFPSWTKLLPSYPLVMTNIAMV